MPELDVEWERLADRIAAPPFRRPGWYHAWRRAFASGEPRTIEVRRDGELRGIVPMLGQPGKLVPQAGWHSPSFGLLFEDDCARQELGRQLFTQPEPLVDLNLLATEGAGGIAAFERAAREAGRLCVVRELFRSPFVDLPDTFEEFEGALSGNRRRALRRKRRRLEEVGEVAFEVHDGTVDLDSLLAQLFALEAGGWKAEGGEPVTSTPELARYYHEIAHWAAERDWLRLAFLRLDGRPIAAQLIIEYGGTWYFWRTGYDEDYRAYGPGAALMVEQIAHCCRQPGLRRIDMLGGTDAFKAEWATGSAPRYWMLAFRRNPAGLTRWANSALRKRVGPSLRRIAGRIR